MLFKIAFLTTFISIIKLYDQILIFGHPWAYLGLPGHKRGSLFRVVQGLGGRIKRILVLHTHKDVKPSKHLWHPDLARLSQIFYIFPRTINQTFLPNAILTLVNIKTIFAGSLWKMYQIPPNFACYSFYPMNMLLLERYSEKNVMFNLPLGLKSGNAGNVLNSCLEPFVFIGPEVR